MRSRKAIGSPTVKTDSSMRIPAGAALPLRRLSGLVWIPTVPFDGEVERLAAVADVLFADVRKGDFLISVRLERQELLQARCHCGALLQRQRFVQPFRPVRRRRNVQRGSLAVLCDGGASANLTVVRHDDGLVRAGA
jgi:hypothetical protein